MAKGKTSERDRLPNRKYVTVSLGADSTVAGATTFDTMMGAREGAGWLISRLDVQHRGLGGGWGNSETTIRWQLCTGAQVGLLEVSDDEVIGTIDSNTVVAGASGALQIQTPLTWVGPVLVASRELSAVVDASSDITPYQNTVWIMTIWYQWVKLGAREWVEIAEARGIA